MSGCEKKSFDWDLELGSGIDFSLCPVTKAQTEVYATLIQLEVGKVGMPPLLQVSKRCSSILFSEKFSSF